MSKQIASATGMPPMSSGSRRVPVSMSRPTSRSRSKNWYLVNTARSGMYSPNGTGCHFV